MSKSTNISWCDSTGNIVIGCTKVSAGCLNCYAESDTPARVLRHRGIETWGPKGVRHPVKSFEANMLAWNRKPWICDQCGHAMTEDESKNYRGCPSDDSTIRRLNDSTVEPLNGLTVEPLNRLTVHAAAHHRRRVFADSNGDWLDKQWPTERLAHFLDVISRCPDMDILLLTKRPENFEKRLHEAHLYAHRTNWITEWLRGQPPRHVWVGASVENQPCADERIPELLKIPAAVRFLSAEPLLGDIRFRTPADFMGPDGKRGIHWVIVGGESGPGARWCNLDWIRSIVYQCKSSSVACHVKQLGSHPCMGREDAQIIRHKKGGEPSEWPGDLRVREFPKT